MISAVGFTTSHRTQINKLKIAQFIILFDFKVVLVEWREDKYNKQKKAFSFLLQRYKVNIFMLTIF